MTQNYANHAHRPIPTIVAGVFIISALVCVVMAWCGWNTMGSAVACLIIVVFVLAGAGRTYTTTLQDRIIRMEMQYRTDRLLPEADRKGYATLGIKQIVALRFASDAELPALAKRAVAEHLTAADIKKAVTNWQADTLRT